MHYYYYDYLSMAVSIRSDPYEDPEAILPKQRGRKSSKGNPKRDGFAPRDSQGSKGIYEEPRRQKPKVPSHPPPSHRPDSDDVDELVRIIKGVWS